MVLGVGTITHAHYLTIPPRLRIYVKVANIYAVYSLFGITYALPAFISIKCHVYAMYHSKQNNYDKFVIFHSLWHATGVGLILLSFAANGLRECLGE
jgi:hypothetical protein